ncbi:zinc transporter ZupT [Boseongicola aestuarii]|uniref:Zinc transporter ZupT n=1 Tax=Boseongicola aestuarii TaxID=1470561 RepID=A0A238J5M8_9RHOB|nr:zinc transporter ZupT [Boseongicola aestuarii]
MESLTPITLGFLGSLIAGLMTALGAVPILFGEVPRRGTRDMSLGFAAGVMLSASFFSLIIPAIESAGEMYGEGAIPAGVAVIGILAGMALVAGLKETLPHQHFNT